MRKGRQFAVLSVAALGAWLWAGQAARGQGVPSWAAQAAASADGGPGTKHMSVVHAEPAYRAPPHDAGQEGWAPYKQMLEFALGFDPLEPSAEELARKKLHLDGGSAAVPAAHRDAGVPDAGTLPSP